MMGDNNVSEDWSHWAREFELVDEVHPEKKLPSRKVSLDMQSNEEPVSAAVSLVVGSARHGVVALCATVAHILREKKKFQQRVEELEKQLVTLENSSSGTVSVSGSCSMHCQATNLYSLQESPVTQRCGSAPASVIASGLKFLRTEYQNNVTSAQGSGSRDHNCNDDYHGTRESRTGECRTSSISMPETQCDLVPKIVNNCDRKTSFNRGSSQASTRSLNISQSLPARSFVRRKYSTISLRRIRRSVANRQKSSSNCSTSSINSYASYANSEEQRRNSSNSSCIITVAEIHTPHKERPSENTEGEAVRLLARRLTSVLQADTIDQENTGNESVGIENEVPYSQAPKPCDPTEFCLPHPIAGCECVVCLRLAADTSCQLYALTAEGGSLLPPGSRVLVEGERVGTVMYLGHEKYAMKSQCAVYPGSVDNSLAQEDCVRPVGITVKLWAPDQGEIFVPLSAVICQLDDDLDFPRKESWSSIDYEYVEEDSDGEPIPSGSIDSLDRSKPETDASNSESGLSEVELKSNENPDVSEHIQETRGSVISDWKSTPENYFIRSPSVSSCSSVISRSLGDLSVYGLECEEEEDDVEMNREVEIRDRPLTTRSCHPTTSFLHNRSSDFMSSNLDETHEVNCSTDSALNNTFICKGGNDDRLQQDYSGSLYDTCDSAISLSFTRRLHYNEDNSEPPSLTDTLDSGCSVGRARCRSDSSGHFSDVELDNTRLGNTFTKSLGDALNRVLEKHDIKRNWPVEKYSVDSEKNDYDILPLNRHVFQRHQRRKEPPSGYQIPLKENPSSAKLEVQGNITGQSEV